MKARLASHLLLTALLLTAARAEDAPKAPVEQPKLHIVVIDNLQFRGKIITEFDRIDLAFQYVAKQRKWPVPVTAERLAANTPDHLIELRVFNQGLREDIGNEFTFRSWMTLVVRGVKHDLGIITFRYTARPWQNTDDVYETVFRGAANAAADKIEPLIFTRVPGRPASSSDAVPGKR